jgi:hypothetical protein
MQFSLRTTTRRHCSMQKAAAGMPDEKTGAIEKAGTHLKKQN